MTRLCRGCGNEITGGHVPFENKIVGGWFHLDCLNSYTLGHNDAVQGKPENLPPEHTCDKLCRACDQLYEELTGGGQGPGARVEGSQELSISPASALSAERLANFTGEWAEWRHCNFCHFEFFGFHHCPAKP